MEMTMAPLPPLPENNTTRLFLDYTSLGRKHTLLLRMNGQPTPTAMNAVYEGAATAMSLIMLSSDSITGARVSLEGDDFTLPFEVEPKTGALNPATQQWAEDPESSFLSLPGRSSRGRKLALKFFSPARVAARPANNRFAAGQATAIDNFRAAFIAGVTGDFESGAQICAIDGFPIVWSSYVNIAFSAYWQRRQRRTG